MKKILLVAALGFMVVVTHAQNFERTYGTNYETPPQVIKAIGGGFILAGATTFPGAASGLTSDILIVKTDSLGFMEWSESFQSSLDDEAITIEAQADSTYLICGNSYDNNNGKLDVFVIRMNMTGGIIGQHLYRSYDAERAACLHHTSDGGSIIAGETLINLADLQMYLLKLDSAGNIEWSMSYGDNDQEYGTAVMQTPDKGYITTGVARINSFASSICVVKTDSAGGLKWAKKYNTNPIQSKCNVSRILASDDGGYFICGSTDNVGPRPNILVMKIDSAGGIVWQNMYASGDVEFCFDAFNDANGVTVCGPATTQNGTDNTLLFNVDGTGNLTWQLGFSVTDSSMTPNSVFKNSNGKYVLAGVTDVTAFGLPHFLLLQTDSLNNQSLCNSFQPSLTSTPTSLVATSFNTFTVDTSTSVGGSYTVAVGVGEDLICTGTVSVPENLHNDLKIYLDANGNIVLDQSGEDASAIKLYDIEGRLVKSISNHASHAIILSGDERKSKHIGNGTYMLVDDFGKERVVRKFVLN